MTSDSIIIVFTAVLTYVVMFVNGKGANIPVQNTCASPLSGTIHGFQADDCTAFPCRVTKERSYRVDFRFTPGKESKFIHLKCGTMLFNRPQTLRDTNVCGSLTEGACPFVITENYTYTTYFKVPYWVPPARYDISCQLADDEGKNLMCGDGSVQVL